MRYKLLGRMASEPEAKASYVGVTFEAKDEEEAQEIAEKYDLMFAGYGKHSFEPVGEAEKDKSLSLREEIVAHFLWEFGYKGIPVEHNGYKGKLIPDGVEKEIAEDLGEFVENLLKGEV